MARGHTIVTVVFAAMAVWFMWNPVKAEIPIEPGADVDRSQLVDGTRRTPMTDPPTMYLGGFDRDCMDCHQIFKGRGLPHLLRQHTDIVLEHGRNSRCLSCHLKGDRNRLSLQGDESVPYAESDQLCGKCHGPAWRDWRDGSHGRTTGSWNKEDPRHRRLTCTECHDPHRPAYPKYTPLPGPRTLRMGEPTEHEHHSDSPLMQRETP